MNYELFLKSNYDLSKIPEITQEHSQVTKNRIIASDKIYSLFATIFRLCFWIRNWVTPLTIENSCCFGPLTSVENSFFNYFRIIQCPWEILHMDTNRCTILIDIWIIFIFLDHPQISLSQVHMESIGNPNTSKHWNSVGNFCSLFRYCQRNFFLGNQLRPPGVFLGDIW